MEGVVVSAKKAGGDRHRQCRDRRQGPLQLPGQQAGAGPIRAQHRARSATSSKVRATPISPPDRRPASRSSSARRRTSRSKCPMPNGSRASRDRPGEQGHPQLRELSQPRSHRALAIQRRAVPGRVQPDGRLLPRQHAGASAAARRQRATLARPGRRREGDRGISLPDQSEPRNLALSAQDAAAPDRPLQPLHRHGIRSAAAANPAARCHRRRSGHHLVQPLRRAVPRQV